MHHPQLRNSIEKSEIKWLDQIEGVLFDIGDTMIDSRDIIKRSAIDGAINLKKLGLIEDIEEFVLTFNEIDREFKEIHTNHLFSNLKIIEETVMEIDLPKKIAVIGAFLSFYRDAVRRLIIFDPYLYDLIKSIKGYGKKVGIISDGTTIEQMEILTRLGIIHLLDSIIISEEIGYEKPSIKLFEKAMKEFGLPASAIIMIGDNYERDVIGAKNAGCRAVLLQNSTCWTPKYEFMPDITISEVSSLRELF
jgi:putative hydrolase of the HAD superfamily